MVARHGPIGLMRRFMLGRRDRALPVERVYAIGDVHGRFDLLEDMIELIAADQSARGSVPFRLVLLGDLVDRGPESARVIRACMRLTAFSERVTVLKGNHEAMMSAALDGDFTALQHWLALGGRETLLSYGLPEVLLAQGGTIELLDAARAAVGETVLGWLAALPLSLRFERFFLVHAGIRPGRHLSGQRQEDLVSIREPFLSSTADHGAIVVHGHTICEAGPDVFPNRIGIDTGAYRTGRLTALGLEPGEVWRLSTMPTSDRVRPPEPCTSPAPVRLATHTMSRDAVGTPDLAQTDA